LLQAYIQRAKLPISDYINDTKTVTDQIPRLLAAMQYIVAQDLNIAGNLDLLCQFTRVRQVVYTRTSVDEDPFDLLHGVPRDMLRKLKQAAHSRKMDSLTLWGLRSKQKAETTKLLKSIWKGPKNEVDRLTESIYSLPFYNVEELKVEHKVDKATGKNIGILRISFAVEGGRKRGRGDSPDTTLALVLGSPARKTLLAQRSIGIRNGNSKNQVELRFDWTAANVGGGEGGGSMILRIMFEEHRGLDSEILVPLRVASN
jgi:hypothetical protein